MATSIEVLQMLIPDGGYVISDDTFEGIKFLEARPITKAQFSNGFAEYDKWKAEQDAAAAVVIEANAAAKASGLAKLAALGFTPEEVAAWWG
jgi:hypothetical protein